MKKNNERFSLSHTFTILAPVELRFIPIYLIGKTGVNRDESEWKRRKSSINTVSHDAPTVSTRFVYGSTTTHAGSATIHPAVMELRMLKNAHDAVTIRYGATTVQAGSATTASRSPTNVHDLAVCQ